MNIYYLGPVGTFSYLMAKKEYCEKENTLIAQPSFEAIFSKILEDPNSIGILPIENSITSNVHENLDYLFKPGIEIVKESYYSIKLNLFCKKESNLEDLREVYSHSKALEQCSDFIKNNNLNKIAISSTAHAIKKLKESNDKAISAIGSEINDSANDSANDNLKLLEENIGNQKVNFTRFLHVRKKVQTDYSKVLGLKLSIVFKLPHISGALAKLLSELEKENINLSKIESRPIPGSNFEYNFWIDLELKTENSYQKLNRILEEQTNQFRIAGKYKLAKI